MRSNKNSRRDFVKKSALGAGGLAFGSQYFFASGSGNIIDAGSDTAKMDINLANDGSTWSFFTPREEISPGFNMITGDINTGKLQLLINGKKNPDSVGCWLRKLPLINKDHRYQVEASFNINGVENKNKSIRAIVTRNGREYAELTRLEKNKEWNRLSVEFAPNRDEENLEIRLYLIDGDNGTVKWKDINIKDISDEYRPRLVNIAAISGRPSNPPTPSDAIEFYCKRIDKIRNKDLDLICLGELINTDRVAGDKDALAESIPGPSTKRLGEKAIEYNTYIAASLKEREGGLIYNTSVLIDRRGKVVGKYRKIHLTIGEQMISGVKPGKDYPVFQTDFGKVGLMICYDNHYPEVSRILAVKGAELIAFSNDSDGREWPNGARGNVWEPYMRTRAIDSHVAIVAAVNGGR